VTQPVKIWHEADGRLLRLRLNRPKANLVDAAMIAALDPALDHLGNGQLGAALIDAEGPHFSFGASVEEHLPSQCTAMLAGLHRLVLRMVESPVPLLLAVRGQLPRRRAGTRACRSSHVRHPGKPISASRK